MSSFACSGNTPGRWPSRDLENLESQACRQFVPANCRNLKVNVRVEGLTGEPVLLPVWIMAYRYRDQVFRFLVNGQTGRCTGTAPTSYRKIAAVDRHRDCGHRRRTDLHGDCRRDWRPIAGTKPGTKLVPVYWELTLIGGTPGPGLVPAKNNSRRLAIE